MPRTKAKAIFDAGVQIPANAVAGRVLVTDGSGNGDWKDQVVAYYEQPTDPGVTTPAIIWIDTDDAPPASNQSLVPVGTILCTAIPNTGQANAPTGFLFCDGTPQSRALYAALFAAVGTAYGAGDGSTTFNLPDLTGRFPMGAGTAAGANGATAHALGQESGEEKHTLSAAETGVPAHGHADTLGTGAGTAHAHALQTQGELVASGSFSYSGKMLAGSGTGAGTTMTEASHTHPVTGGVTNHAGTAATPHSILPPFTAVNYMVKF